MRWLIFKKKTSWLHGINDEPFDTEASHPRVLESRVEVEIPSNYVTLHVPMKDGLNAANKGKHRKENHILIGLNNC